MKKNARKKWLVGLSTAASLCLLTTVGMSAKALAEVEAKTLDEITVMMKEGASVRYADSYADNGLRYRLQMSVSDYEGLKKDNADVSFGMFIAPADYETDYGTLNEKNLITTPIYGWVDKQADGTYPEYTGSLTEIIHLSSTVMGEVDGMMCWHGSIVDLIPENRDREFIAVGYVKDGDTYKFAERNDNARSMTYVAQLAQTDEKLTGTQKTNLYNNYIAPFVTENVSYTVKHVYDDGANVTEETAKTDTAALNSEITYAVPESVEKDGIVYTAESKELKSVAYANGKTVFEVVYKSKSTESYALANQTVANKTVEMDGLRIASTISPLSVATSETGLTATSTGGNSSIWNGLKLNFTDLKPDANYTLRFKLTGQSDVAFHLDTTFTSNGLTDGYYNVAYTNGGLNWTPTEDGTEVLVALSTPDVKFDTYTVSLQARATTAYSYTISSIDVTENRSATILKADGTPFAWADNKAIVGEPITLTVDQSNLAGDVTWSSTNEAVATVENGTVTFLTAGKAEITATVAGKTLYADFVVYNADKSYAKTSGNLSMQYDANSPADFDLVLAEGKELKVLQISDPQIADVAQVRSGRSLGSSAALWDDRGVAVYDNLQRTIDKANPDLILVAGDIVYGEFDDNGTILQEFVAFMESQKIFWAPVYGNHDNESDKGAAWQNRQFLNADYCLFGVGEVTGNGNYVLSVKQGGAYLTNIYMLDTNGCVYSNVGDNRGQGLYPTTVAWMQNVDASLKTYQKTETKDVVCMHIPVTNAYKALEALGLTTSNLDVNFDTDENADSFGHVVAAAEYMSNASDYNYSTLNTAAKTTYDLTSIFATMGVTNANFGHCHKTNASAVYEGVRYTFGLKTGAIPDYNQNETGGTLMTLTANGYQVEHCYDTYEQNVLTGFDTASGFNASNTVRTQEGYRFAYVGTTGWQSLTFNTPYQIEAGKSYVLTVKLRVNELTGATMSELHLFDTVKSYTNAWSLITGETDEYMQTWTIAATENADYTVGFACNYTGGAHTYDLEYFDVTLEEVVPDLFTEKITANSASHGNVSFATTKDSGTISVDTGTSATAHKITLQTKYAVKANTAYHVSFTVSNVVLNSTATNANINFYMYSTKGYQALSKATNGFVWENFTASADGYYNLVIYFNAASQGVSFTISNFTLQEFTPNAFVNKSGSGVDFAEIPSGALCTGNGTNTWNTLTLNTTCTLEAGKTYTITLTVSNITATGSAAASNIHYQGTEFGVSGWTSITSLTNENGVYMKTVTYTATETAVLSLKFAVNAATQGLQFVVNYNVQEVTA